MVSHVTDLRRHIDDVVDESVELLVLVVEITVLQTSLSDVIAIYRPRYTQRIKHLTETRSSAVAKRPRDASSLYSFNTKSRAQSFITRHSLVRAKGEVFVTRHSLV